MVKSLVTRLRSRLACESGTMLLELLMAMTILAVAIGAFMSLYAASAMSLRRASVSGSALTLVERQMESYRSLVYDDLAVSSATIPAAGTTYFTVRPTAVPVSFSNITGAATASSACVEPSDPLPGCARQTITGPDNRSYTIDSYIVTETPAGGRAGKQITVAVRLTSEAAGTIRAQATSAFDAASATP
jgi:Tfp pilus assembly protein PilV